MIYRMELLSGGLIYPNRARLTSGQRCVLPAFFLPAFRGGSKLLSEIKLQNFREHNGAEQILFSSTAHASDCEVDLYWSRITTTPELSFRNVLESRHEQ